MESTFTYDVVAYRQSQNSKAPYLLSFVVKSEELLQWAGIPRRADDRLIGFQRPDDPLRVASAQEFFNTGPNQSPTALIVGIHKDSHQAHLTLEKPLGPEIVPGKLRIKADASYISIAEVVSRVRAQLTSRLNKEQIEDIQESNAIDQDECLIDTIEEALVGDDEILDDEVEIGRSIISQLLARLDDADWVQSNESHLREIVKPATIIDGQHRLLGAAQCERGIPFLVCAIYDCPWEEQVFQFTIVNYKQKGIPDQFITANAALSLTKSELEVLQDRLVQANVKVVEYELMKTVQFDSRSPFFGLVNLTEKSAPDLIGYKTMVRIANGWYNANSPFFNLLLAALYPDISGKGAKARRKERWKNSDWSEFFIDYWTAVKAHYGDADSHEEGHSLWQVGYSQMMVAIVLLEFQNVFFQSLTDQDEEFFETQGEPSIDAMRQKLRKRAAKLFESFPRELFSTYWHEHSLNTGAGRSSLQMVFREMKTNKGNWNWKNSTLVKGQA